MLKKPAAVALTALLLGLGVAGATSSAAFAGPPGHVYHQGYWGGGRWHGGWWGPAVGLGILGLAAGAAIASESSAYPPPPAYDYGPGPGPDSCMSYQPVYDRWHRYVGRGWVDICQ
jgi:hypothetical protein